MQSNTAFYEFMSLTKALADLEPHTQIWALRYNLLRTLYRATDAEERIGALEKQVAALRDERALRAWEYAELASQLRRELDGHAPAQDGTAATDERCRELELLCRSLLLTIERAAFGEATNGGNEDVASCAATPSP